jgi:hypothetical protein
VEATLAGTAPESAHLQFVLVVRDRESNGMRAAAATARRRQLLTTAGQLSQSIPTGSRRRCPDGGIP